MALGWAHALDITAAGLHIALAVLLLALNFNHRANRAFALFLVPQGLVYFSRAMQNLPEPAPDDPLWAAVRPYMTLFALVCMFYFASVYPKRRRWVLPGPLGFLPFLLVAAALCGAYALDHSLYLAPNAPLGAVVSLLSSPGALLLALLLLREALRSADSPATRGAWLLSMGFAGIAAFDTLWTSLFLLLTPGNLSAFWDTRRGVVLSLVPGTLLLALIVIVLLRRGPAAASAHRMARRYLAMLGVAAVTVVAARADTELATAFNLLWNMALPFFGTYALLRHQLFGVEVRVKWAIKQSTVAAAFVGVFFVVSESAGTFFSASGLGPYLGIAAAGALVFLMAPLQRVAERVATAALPGVRGAGELTHPERVELYRQQVRAAWADGVLSSDERNLLRVARTQLGLSLEEADRVEQDVEASARRAQGSGGATS